MQVQSRSSLGRMRQATVTLCIAVLSLTLPGCSGGVDEELRSYTERVLKRKAKPLPPPDPPEPYFVYTYSGEGVDPFKPFFQEPEKEALEDDAGGEWAPIAGRIKEELEGHPLDSLRMVGTLEQGTEGWGVILSRDGTVYRVQVGNYMGQNYGKIIAILEDRIELEERARDTRGKWQLREASLALAE